MHVHPMEKFGKCRVDGPCFESCYAAVGVWNAPFQGSVAKVEGHVQGFRA